MNTLNPCGCSRYFKCKKHSLSYDEILKQAEIKKPISQNKIFNPLLCSWCQSDKATTKYMNVLVCDDCKFNKLNHESNGEKYDRYISYGLTDLEARMDSGYEI